MPRAFWKFWVLGFTKTRVHKKATKENHKSWFYMHLAHENDAYAPNDLKDLMTSTDPKEVLRTFAKIQNHFYAGKKGVKANEGIFWYSNNAFGSPIPDSQVGRSGNLSCLAEKYGVPASSFHIWKKNGKDQIMLAFPEQLFAHPTKAWSLWEAPDGNITDAGAQIGLSHAVVRITPHQWEDKSKFNNIRRDLVFEAVKQMHVQFSDDEPYVTWCI